MPTQEQTLGFLMVSGALVSLVAASYMLYTSYQEIQSLKKQAIIARRYFEKIITAK